MAPAVGRREHRRELDRRDSDRLGIQPPGGHTSRAGALAFLLDFDGDDTSAIEDVVVATKVRIVSEGTHRPAFGVRMATKLPNAPNQSGLGTDVTDFAFAVLIGKTVRSVRIVGNIGVAIIGDPTQNAVQYDPTIFGVSLARALAPGVEIVGELRRPLAGLRDHRTTRRRESLRSAWGNALHAGRRACRCGPRHGLPERQSRR